MPIRPDAEIVEFRDDDPTPAIRAIEVLVGSRDGWVNLQANGAEDPVEAPRGKAGIFGWFSSKGPELPVCTWVPGGFDRRGGIDADEVGIQHPGGPKALVQLRERGTTPPEGWRRMADHPKRGLVLASTHPTTPPDVAPMVSWLIAASKDLSTEPLPASWTATLYRR